MALEQTNIISLVGASAVGGVVSYLVTRFAKSHDVRAAAEAALIGIGPSIITEQNRRIEFLTTENNKMWAQINEMWNSLAKSREEHADCLRRLAICEGRLDREDD